jgi:hypothetical protein
MKNNDYWILVDWPESQNYMDKEGFRENSSLADFDLAGSSAYFIRLGWMKTIK